MKKVNSDFEHPVPFRYDPPTVCNNKWMVDRRLLKKKKRLLTDPELLQKYENENEALINEVYAEHVPDAETTWYLLYLMYRGQMNLISA